MVIHSDEFGIEEVLNLKIDVVRWTSILQQKTTIYGLVVSLCRYQWTMNMLNHLNNRPQRYDLGRYQLVEVVVPCP